jgi:hypothetical protein
MESRSASDRAVGWARLGAGSLFGGRRRHHQTYVESLDRFQRDRKMFYIAKQQGSTAVDQQLLHLVGVKAVSSGTAVRPAAMIPKYAATQRGWFAARIATRASRGTRVESQFATLSDIRVSSANVTRSPSAAAESQGQCCRGTFGLIPGLLLAVVAFTTAGVAKDKHLPLPPQIGLAKTVYIDNQSGFAKMGDRAYEQVTKWGRW